MSVLLLSRGTNLFAGTSGGGVFLSTNNGTSWTAVNTGLTNTDVLCSCRLRHESLCRNLWQRRLSFHQQRHKLDCSQYRLDEHLCLVLLPSLARISLPGLLVGGVFLSTNNGTSWTAVNTGLTNTYVYALAVSGTNLFAGTYGGGVFLSTNNGTSWTAVNTGLTNTVCLVLLPSPARISLPGLTAAASFFPPTTAQAGLRSIPA